MAKSKFAAFLDKLHNPYFISYKISFVSYFIFLSSNNTFFINHTLKFKYQPSHLKVNIGWNI